MVFLTDGSIDSIQTLLSTGEDSNGKKLNFKQNKDGGYQAEGTDGKLYSIDLPEATAKVSVSIIPEETEKEKKTATTTTTTTASPPTTTTTGKK